MEGKALNDQQDVLLLIEAQLDELNRELEMYEKEAEFLESNITHAFSVVSKQIDRATSRRTRMLKRMKRFEEEINKLKFLFSKESLGKQIPALAEQNSSEMMNRVFGRTDKSIQKLKEDIALIQLRVAEQTSRSRFIMCPSVVSLIALIIVIVCGTITFLLMKKVIEIILTADVDYLSLDIFQMLKWFYSNLDTVRNSTTFSSLSHLV